MSQDAWSHVTRLGCGNLFVGAVRRLDEFQANLTTDNCRGFLKSAEGHGIVLGIKEAVKRGAAGAHTPRHLDLGQAFLVHGSLNLAGNYPLDGPGTNLLREACLPRPT